MVCYKYTCKIKFVKLLKYLNLFFYYNTKSFKDYFLKYVFFISNNIQ